MQIRDVTLKALEFVASQRLDRSSMEGFSSELLTSQVGDSLVFQLRSLIWSDPGEEIVRQSSYEEPATWWDHFKKDVLKWNYKKVAYTLTVKVIPSVLYPDLKSLPLPGRSTIHVVVSEGIVSRREE
jgi:hypothetical protein